MFLLVLTRGLPILITYTHYSFSKPQAHTSLNKSVNVTAFLLFYNSIHISRTLLSSVILYLRDVLFHSIQLEISLHRINALRFQHESPILQPRFLWHFATISIVVSSMFLKKYTSFHLFATNNTILKHTKFIDLQGKVYETILTVHASVLFAIARS